MNHYYAVVLKDETGFITRNTYTNGFESDAHAITYYEAIYGDRLLTAHKMIQRDSVVTWKRILSRSLART